MVESAFPIVSTHDLSGALEFWRDALGGVVSYRFPDDGEARYVGVDLGRSHLGLSVAEDAEPGDGPRAISIWCYVADCDAAVERVRIGGFTVIQEPADQPWGERIARVSDADGNEVILGAERAPGR